MGHRMCRGFLVVMAPCLVLNDLVNLTIVWLHHGFQRDIRQPTVIVNLGRASKYSCFSLLLM